MKIILTYILIVISFIAYGQKSNTIFSTGSNGVQNWTYQDFIDNDINRIQAFSFNIKKNGKVKKDSIKLYDQSIDLKTNTVSGINCNLNWQSHGPSFLTWYKFTDSYNDKGLLEKHLDQPLEVIKTKEFGSLNWNINLNETVFEYNEKGLKTKKIYNRIENYYSVSKYTKDTFHLYSVHPKIYEYEYNLNGQEIRNYHTDDSTRYFKTNSYTPDSNSVTCSYCDPRYLNGEKEYDSNGNLKKWIWYTRKNEIHSKKYYFYDDSNNLIKRIDSTGWYYSTKEPYWQSTTTYNYSDSGKTETVNYYTEDRFESSTQKTSTEYDENGRILSQCSFTDSTQTCDNYSYKYENNNLIRVYADYKDKSKATTEYKYSQTNLLIEERHLYNGKLTSLTKYYYKK